MSDWQSADTTTHQDHVIAHVIGTTVLAYLVVGDAVHVLLDIGFIWKIYVDGEMGLLPHPVAVAELDVEDDVRNQIKADIDLILRDGRTAVPVGQLTTVDIDCVIAEVICFAHDDENRFVLAGEGQDLEIMTSVTHNRILVTGSSG